MNYFNYYTEIEDAFIRRRGKHLLLSPMDWALIESWKAMGVPLHVALQGIEHSFNSHNAKPRRRSVKTLMYCQEEVDALFAEWFDRQRGAATTTTPGTEGADAADKDEGGTTGANGHAATKAGADDGLPFPREVISAHLAQCRAALERTREHRATLGGVDELVEALVRTASRLDELAADFARTARPNAEHLENSLTDLEQLLDRAILATLPAEHLATKRAETAEQLRAYRTRMERATYEQTLENLLAKRLREECGVPRLSLFYL